MDGTTDMDMNQAAQRILRRHWAVILLLVAVGVCVPLALDRYQSPVYEGSARFTIGSPDTRDGQQAGALADTALALATSPETVAAAVTESQYARDPLAVAEQVRVAPIGSSGVLEVTVTDENSRASAAIANALAREIVRLRDEALFADGRGVLARIEQDISAYSAQIAQVEQEAAQREARYQRVDALTLRHDELVAQRAGLEDVRQQLTQALATAQAPQIVSASAVHGIPTATVLHIQLAIGALLGAILGIALAATLESWRPTLAGPAIARYLGAPFLGCLPRPPRHDSTIRSPWLANYLLLAADGAGVRSIQLVPVGPVVDVAGLARTLDLGKTGPRVVARPLDASWDVDEDRPARRETGIVAVTPNVVKGRAMFQELEWHAELARMPIIGVLTYKGRPRRADRRAAAAARRPATADQPERSDEVRPTVAPVG
jgi:capsular polysaccharide biosynthesis protein